MNGPLTVRKKPVEVEAMLLSGESLKDVAEWCGGTARRGSSEVAPSILIRTLEGDMVAYAGDWIIKGVAGEFYPCKREIFEATYEVPDVASGAA